MEAFGLDLDAGDLDRAYDEILNGAEEEIDDFSIDIDIYLYKGEIAEIGFDDGDGNGFRLEMTGEKGAISSNFECTVFFEKRSGYTISRTSEYKNGVESGNLYMKGHIQEYRIDYTYNTNTGEYSIQFPAMEGLPAFQTEGNFHASNREVQFTTNLNVMGQSIDLDLTVGKGADIKALSGGIFEIGDKSEGELESEAMKLQENSVFERIFD
ncbi:MAG: hypothetical protein IJ733_11550 [Lachnospiraceae bacterium]|nr:hypothetical protein [Lachnospiraceae bacterium]